MAFTLPATVSIRIQDEMGVIAPFTAYALLDSTQTVDTVVADLGGLVTAVDAVTDGTIQSWRIALNPPIPGSPHTLVAGARVEQTGLFNFRATGTPHRFGEAVPAFASSKIVSGHIDLTDTAVAALIAFLTAALTSAEWVSNHQEVLTSLRDALVSFRKRRKQTTRVSFEV